MPFMLHRISVDFTHKKKPARRNVNVGQQFIIKAYADNNRVIVTAQHAFGNDTVEADVALKVENIKVAAGGGAGVGAAAAVGKKRKLPAHFAYLDDDTDATIEIVEWKPEAKPDEFKQRALQSTVGYLLKEVADLCTTVTSKDITTIRRDGTLELWTHRDFAANTLVLAPLTTEMKDRMWTYTKSVLVANTAPLHPERKHVVLDGRLRSDVKEGKNGVLFFMVEKSDDKAIANMQIDVVEASTSVSLKMPWQKVEKEATKKKEELPGIPIMYNPKKIQKGQKLICFDDHSLEKLHKKEKTSEMKAKLSGRE